MTPKTDRRRPGRPALREGESSAPLSTRVTTPTYDRVVTIAQQRRVPVGQVVRDAVERFCSEK